MEKQINVSVLVTRVYPITYQVTRSTKTYFVGEPAYRFMRKQEEGELQEMLRDAVPNLTQKVKLELKPTIYGPGLGSFHQDDPETFNAVCKEMASDIRMDKVGQRVSRFLASSLIKCRCVDIHTHEDFVIIFWLSHMIPRLEEGKSLKICNIVSSENKKPNDVCYSSTPTTYITNVENDGEPYQYDYSRRLYSLREILMWESLFPPYNEVDIVARVLEIGDATVAAGQIITLCDDRGNRLFVKFWNSLKATGVDSVVAVGAMVSVRNLSVRVQSKKNNMIFVQDSTVFTPN